jgi:hypothetical protein
VSTNREPTIDKGFGLRDSQDMRDALYPMRAALESVSVLPEYRYWDRGDTLDQGRQGACVGFGWTAWYNCRPRGFYAQKGGDYARSVYRRAQEIDEWEDTPPGEGTSVRAGARIMLADFTLTEYLWARTADEVRAWIKAKGPVVIGSKWLTGMYDTDAGGYLRVEGSISGGHCTMLYAAARNDDVLGQNSWGDDWGKEGSFKLSKASLDKLISLGGFVACTAHHTGLAA